MKNFLKSLKVKWNAYLQRLTESNKKLYGNERLDCCGLNKQNKTIHNKG